MQVSHDEGVAIHIGPESCAVAREGFGEALTGGRIGQPLPIRPRPAKQSKVRQKPDTTEGPSAVQSLDDAEIEKLKPKLTICRGWKLRRASASSGVPAHQSRARNPPALPEAAAATSVRSTTKTSIPRRLRK